MRAWTAVTLVLVVAGCTSRPAARITRVERGLLPPTIVLGEPLPAMTIEARMKAHSIPGASIAVINNYRIEWVKGYGVKETGKPDPVTADTLFQAGSISKVIASVAALELVERGALALDRDVNRSLTTWKIPENEFTATEKVTLRRLLTHTSGLQPTSSGEYEAGDPIPTLAEILDGLPPAKTPPMRVVETPGSRYVYSGSPFIVLQQLLTDVARTQFAKLLDELVLRPAHMTDSTFEQPLPARLGPRAASGHYPGTTVVKGKWQTKPELAVAGLWTTARDLARFTIELQNAPRGRSRLLSREAATEMLTPQQGTTSGGSGVQHIAPGLGVELNRVNGFLRFGHSGRTTGYTSELVAFADGRGAVIMTNGYAQAFAREVLRAIAREYAWPEFQATEITVVNVTPQVLGEYAGRYEFPEGRRPKIAVVEVKGTMLLFDGVALRPQSQSKFFSTSGATVTFIRDERGAVVALVNDIGSTQLTARRLP